MALAHAHPYCPPGDSLEDRKEVSLYFCRDPTLPLFYRLFIIFTQLYICSPPKSLLR